MKKKWLWAITLIVIVGFWLRVYKLSAGFPFSGEMGDNLWHVREAIESGNLPFLGPPTSHPWLSFGPLYYWLLIPPLKIFSFNPMVAEWLGILAGTLAIILNYIVVGKIFSNRVGLISSFLMAVSPLWLSFSKDARFYFLVTLIFYPLFLSLYNLSLHKKANIFLIGFWLGLFFNFHYSPILLIPSVFFFLYQERAKLKLKNYLAGFTGFVLPILPLLWQDAENNFSMFRNFIFWLPYRMLGFLGLYPKNNFSLDLGIANLEAINRFLGKSLSYNPQIWVFLSVFIVFYLMIGFYKEIKQKKVSFGWKFICLTTFISLTGTFIHGDAPLHYFLPIFPIPLILVSLFINDVLTKKRPWLKALVGSIFICLIYLNLHDYINYYRQINVEMASLKPLFVPYQLQTKIAEFIVQDAKGQPISLKRVGPGDEFEENYSQNYQYLLWLYGNKPQPSANLSYTIYEDIEKLSKVNKDKTFRSGNIIVLKSDEKK